MGAGTHSVEKCRGRGGYYRVSAMLVEGGRGKWLPLKYRRQSGPAHCRGEPDCFEGLRPAAEGPRPRPSLSAYIGG